MPVYASDRPSVTLAEFEIRFPNIFSAFEIREKTLIYPYNSYRQYGWLQVEIYGVHDDEDLKEKIKLYIFVRKERESKRAFLELIFPTVPAGSCASAPPPPSAPPCKSTAPAK